MSENSVSARGSEALLSAFVAHSRLTAVSVAANPLGPPAILTLAKQVCSLIISHRHFAHSLRVC
jgi:hypothetical protein